MVMKSTLKVLAKKNEQVFKRVVEQATALHLLKQYSPFLEEISKEFPHTTHYVIETSTSIAQLYCSQCVEGENIDLTTVKETLLNATHLMRKVVLKEDKRIIDACVHLMKNTKQLANAVFKEEVRYSHLFPLNMIGGKKIRYNNYTCFSPEHARSYNFPHEYFIYPLTVVEESKNVDNNEEVLTVLNNVFPWIGASPDVILQGKEKELVRSLIKMNVEQFIKMLQFLQSLPISLPQTFQERLKLLTALTALNNGKTATFHVLGNNAL